jgi:hypothetical protein
MPTMYQFASATPYIIIIVSMLICVGIGSTLSSKKDSKHAWNTTYNGKNI